VTDRRTVKLTAARRQWAAQRSKAPTFKGAPLRVNAAVESRYVQQLQALTAQMTAQVKREILRLFNAPVAETHFAQDAAHGPNANLGSQARILVNSLRQRFEALFAKRAGKLADGMVSSAAAASTTALHSSLKDLSGGLSLKTSLMTPALQSTYNAAVAQNVSLIKSIPSQYLTDVEGAVMRSITTGNGLQDLVPALEQYEGQTHRRARNIALDQVRKTYNAINKGRMQAIGVRKFEWVHSGGGAEPRPLHLDVLNGNVYSFDKLPIIDERTGERGIPGQAPNCKCTMAPVFDFSDDEDDDGGQSD
jgi:SPP1 gp7 family putative phage head morphogenesis protein